MDAQQYSGHSMKHSELDLFENVLDKLEEQNAHHKIWETGRNPIVGFDKERKNHKC